MKIKEGFVLREVFDERAIVGEGVETVNFGKMISLNDTAAWIWKQAKEMGDFTIEELSQKLCERYDVTQEVAEKDVKRLVDEWQKLGLL